MADRFVTLEQLRDYGAIPDGADDALLDRLILAATALFQAKLSRRVLTDTYTETRDGLGGTRMMLRNQPITAVHSLQIDGKTVAQRVGGPSSAGYTFDEFGLKLSGGLVFERGTDNVTVSYTAGLAAVPDDIRQACAEVVLLRYRDRERMGFRSKGLAGEAITFTNESFTDFAKSVLNQHQLVVIP